MPVLLNNCSQFIVEFAGDFVTQDNHQFVPDPNNPNVLVANENWGNVTGIGPDNVIDYVVDHSSVTNSDYNVAAKIRWYGLPRDTARAPSEGNGPPVIRGFSPNPSWPRDRWTTANAYGGATRANELIDVVPLNDVIQAYNATVPPNQGYAPAAFERELPAPAPSGDYAADMVNANPAVKAGFRYTCIWANSAPVMIRIVLKLEDPAGRLSEGQWFEYVVGAP